MLNHAYDGVDPLTITQARRRRSSVEPFVNLVAGCTPAWIGEYADKEGADLGRFNRCVIFYADQDRDIRVLSISTRDEQEVFATPVRAKLDRSVEAARRRSSSSRERARNSTSGFTGIAGGCARCPTTCAS